MNIEQWKNVPMYDRYEASNLGRIRSSARGKVLNMQLHHRGYWLVGVRIGGGKYNNELVHRMVALAWVDGYKDGLQVNHKDCNKKNNLPSNLEWVTGQDNMRHASRMGRLKRNKAA